MPRIVVGISSLEQHQAALSKNPEGYRPASCPHCGIGSLWAHGFYERKAERIGHGEELPSLDYRGAFAMNRGSRPLLISSPGFHASGHVY